MTQRKALSMHFANNLLRIHAKSHLSFMPTTSSPSPTGKVWSPLKKLLFSQYVVCSSLEGPFTPFHQILGVKLYSVVPNSMAEERTVSTFTKLNSAERAAQKADTIVNITKVKQHLRRRTTKVCHHLPQYNIFLIEF